MTGTAQMLTVRVPLTARKRGGRTTMVTPDGAPGWHLPQPRVDSTLVKALARAFRWRRMLESGRYSTIKELAAAEKINESYVCRVLRLTLLAPEIVEAILDGRQAAEVTLPVLMNPFPAEWSGHRRLVFGTDAAHREPCGQHQRFRHTRGPSSESHGQGASREHAGADHGCHVEERRAADGAASHPKRRRSPLSWAAQHG
jgi:hypothetical protein